jgi:kynureninase
MTALTRQTCAALDADDALAPLRDQFVLPPDRIYLDGNSLGALPRTTAARVAEVVAQEWGQGLIESWNSADWIGMPQRVGDKIARLIGAGPAEVVAVDSTSINLYKVLSVAIEFAKANSPQRRIIVSERDNFPTDLYIAQSLASQHGFELRLVDADDIGNQFDDSVAILLLTHVNYRSGRIHDMAALTAAAHDAGALVIWDLAHSAGAVPVNLYGQRTEEAADFAVGCGYKYLNGGPGAPAFVWIHPQHAARMDEQQLSQPLSGWLGHAAPFEFSSAYRPAAGINRFICGTPSVIALAALECGVDTVLAAEALGGMAALRVKAIALTSLFIELIAQRCENQGLILISPGDAAQRGSQVSLGHRQGAHAIIQALIARGVTGDYRDPGILRFGFTPLTLRYVDVWDAVEQLVQILDSGEWRQSRFQQRGAVT